MIITRNTEGSVKSVRNAKIATYANSISLMMPETKGTILFRSADDLRNYGQSEGAQSEQLVRDIINLGVKVVVCGSSVEELFHSALDRHGVMIIRISSKFELRRFCRATGCCALIKSRPPTTEELGFASGIEVREFGGSYYTVIVQDSSLCQLSSILIRGPCPQLLDDAERAIDDGLNAYKILCQDARTLPAGGATEIEIANYLYDMARQETGLNAYTIEKFAECLESIPRTLAENSGLNPSTAVASLWSAHLSGCKNVGLDLNRGDTTDLHKVNIVDIFFNEMVGFQAIVRCCSHYS